MDRASRDTEIFSSEVLTQSSMPLQPFTGKVKLELVVVGRLWMLSTGKDGRLRDRGFVSEQHLEVIYFYTAFFYPLLVEELSNAKDILVSYVMCV